MGFDRCGVSDRMGWRIESGPHIGRWVADRIDGGLTERSTAIGLIKNGRIVAGIIYENWNGQSLMAHIAAEGRFTPAYVGAIFDYAYNVCNVHKAIVPVWSTNIRSANMVKKMGFTEEARIKDGCPNGDIIIYTLKKADCRFLGDKYGKKYTSSADAS